EREAALEKRASTIATLRLVTFFAGVALVIGIAFAGLPPATWYALGAVVVAFGALVVVHARVHAAKDRALAAVRFHERALARMAGKWRAFPVKGERFLAEGHP